MYKKILVGIDDSDKSKKAAEHAISIAKKYDSTLIAITVLDIPDIHLLSPRPQELSHQLLEDYIQRTKGRLEEIKQEARRKGVTIETELLDVSARPERAILQYAEKRNIDLIIVGRKGKNDFEKIILGSTALSIATYANCHVMLIDSTT